MADEILYDGDDWPSGCVNTPLMANVSGSAALKIIFVPYRPILNYLMNAIAAHGSFCYHDGLRRKIAILKNALIKYQNILSLSTMDTQFAATSYSTKHKQYYNIETA